MMNLDIKYYPNSTAIVGFTDPAIQLLEIDHNGNLQYMLSHDGAGMFPMMLNITSDEEAVITAERLKRMRGDAK